MACKVYVVQESNKDFSAAREFGELVFLSLDRVDDFHSLDQSRHNDNLVAQLAHELRDFDELRDFLVVTGSPYVCAAVFWLLGHRGTSRLNLLRWDNRDFRYLPLTLQWRR